MGKISCSVEKLELLAERLSTSYITELEEEIKGLTESDDCKLFVCGPEFDYSDVPFEYFTVVAYKNKPNTVPAALVFPSERTAFLACGPTNPIFYRPLLEEVFGKRGYRIQYHREFGPMHLFQCTNFLIEDKKTPAKT